MNKPFLICLFCVMPFIPSLAYGDGFFSAGVSLVTWENEDVIEIDPDNVFIRGGYSINKTFDFGLEWSTTLLKEEIRNVDFKVESYLLFIKVNIPIGERLKLYALTGVSDLELIADGSAQGRAHFDDKGTAVGVGLQYGYEDSGFTIEYTQYYDDEDFDDIQGDVIVEGISFGFNAHF